MGEASGVARGREIGSPIEMSSGWNAGAVVADGAAAGCWIAVPATGASSAAHAQGPLKAAIKIAPSTAIDNGASKLEFKRFTPMTLPAWQRRLGFLRTGIVRILMRAEKRQRVMKTSTMWPRDLHALQIVPATSTGAPIKTQYREILRCVCCPIRTALFSDFAQFVHRVTGSGAASHRVLECSSDGLQTEWQSLFRRRYRHGFDSTASTPILAARRAS